MPAAEVGIEIMPGNAAAGRRSPSRSCSAARDAGIPVVFFQEVHRRSGIDFGRELDGTEGVHCLEGEPVDRTGRLAAPDARTSSTSSSAATPASSAPNSRSCCAACSADDADPHRRSHRRVRALHVRRRPPARLLRPGGLRLRRRLESQHRHNASLDAMEYLQTGAVLHHRRDHRRLRRGRDNASIPVPGGGLHNETKSHLDKAGGAQRRTRRRPGACRLWLVLLQQQRSGGSRPTPDPPTTSCICRFLQDPGQPPDPDIYYAGQGLILTTNTYEGLLHLQDRHRDADSGAAAGDRAGPPRRTTRSSPSSCGRA